MSTHNTDTAQAQVDELPEVRLRVENLNWTEVRLCAARAVSPPLPQTVYDHLGTLLREKLQDRPLTPTDQAQIAQDLLSFSHPNVVDQV